jgi:hypothetical protein
MGVDRPLAGVALFGLRLAVHSPAGIHDRERGNGDNRHYR